MDSGSWPYFACVGISESSSLFGLPGKGCGVCVEVQCVESGPVRARPAHRMRRMVMGNTRSDHQGAVAEHC